MIMNFPNKLKQLRLKNNLSQQKLADMIFVSRTLINKYENGVAIPTKENLEKLANCLNVSVDELFSNEDTLDVVLNHNFKKQNIHFILHVISISILICAVILTFIPLIVAFEYVYPIPPGQQTPDKFYYVSSIMMACLSSGNPLPIIFLIISIICIGLGLFNILYFKDKNKNKAQLTCNIIYYCLFFICLILFFFSMIFAISSVNTVY